MNKSKYIFLSYLLNEDLTAYADGKRLVIDKVRKISSGDSSNNTEIHLPTHFGTHIDFPYHFSDDGKTINDYQSDFFVFSHVVFVDIQNRLDGNEIISNKHFPDLKINRDADLILIKTGYCHIRNNEKYWNNNPPFQPDLASFFRNKFPNLKAIGFDTISLSAWNCRNLGREAHKAFLIENEILLIEDMDLRKIDSSIELEKVIVAPLRLSGLEGAPATVFAEIENIQD